MSDCNFCKEIDFYEIIECIVSALDAKDPYTAGHSERVSDMAIAVCEILNLTEEQTQQIHIAAHLHDIGKIGVPDIVLLKEGRFTDDEWEKMKKHPEIGSEILSKSQQLSELKDIVIHHHERYDGKGC
nr:HD domain-containing phosphohydrolase [uncultured Treponema sp.]